MQYPGNMAKVNASRVLRHGDYVFFLMLGAIDDAAETDEQAATFAEEQTQIAVDAIEAVFNGEEPPVAEKAGSDVSSAVSDAGDAVSDAVSGAGGRDFGCRERRFGRGFGCGRGPHRQLTRPFQPKEQRSGKAPHLSAFLLPNLVCPCAQGVDGGGVKKE